MGKNNKDIICANIRFLRKLYGESPEDLGEVLHCGRTAVYNYETIRIPDHETLVAIANHYSISVEMLMKVDLSDLDNFNLRFDPNAFFRSILNIMPVYLPKNKPEDQAFNAAIEYQQKLFEAFSYIKFSNQNSIEVAFDKLFSDDSSECLSLYPKYYDSEYKAIASANYLSLIFLFWVFFSSIERMKDHPAYLHTMELQSLIKARDVDAMVGDINDEILNSCDEFRDEYYDEVNKMIRALKNEPHWSDLADYYIALRYTTGFVNNGLESTFNNHIGMELMTTYASLGNSIAICFLKYVLESQFGNSQNVDDRQN